MQNSFSFPQTLHHTPPLWFLFLFQNSRQSSSVKRTSKSVLDCLSSLFSMITSLSLICCILFSIQKISFRLFFFSCRMIASILYFQVVSCCQVQKKEEDCIWFKFSSKSNVLLPLIIVFIWNIILMIMVCFWSGILLIIDILCSTLISWWVFGAALCWSWWVFGAAFNGQVLGAALWLCWWFVFRTALCWWFVFRAMLCWWFSFRTALCWWFVFRAALCWSWWPWVFWAALWSWSLMLAMPSFSANIKWKKRREQYKKKKKWKKTFFFFFFFIGWREKERRYKYLNSLNADSTVFLLVVPVHGKKSCFCRWLLVVSTA